MKSLDYLKASSRFSEINPADFTQTVSINLITNFTDDILKNILIGVSLQNSIYPKVYQTPYKQYHLELKNKASGLYHNKPDITFIFFETNPFKESAFKQHKEHFDEILADVERYCDSTTGTVVFNHFITSYQSAYGNLTQHSPFLKLIQEYNRKIDELSSRKSNLVVFDTNRIVHQLGENNVFDLRGMYAFDITFTHDFTTALAEEWFSIVAAISGKAKKCIVLDLDNTLWGGVVGELGPEGIALGPDYPGNAFMNFQRALLDFYNRGIILAINSKNNLEDVIEVFQKNPNMILKEDNFAAIRANWDEKSKNIEDIAQELNIGTDSMVFIDDDPLQREMMRGQHPEVETPDFSIPPEDYTKLLYSLKSFNQLSLTDEDKQKGKMYADERQRQQVFHSSKSVKDYISELGIEIRINLNKEELIPRIAQLTQKTNQFNVTTKRYTEHDIRKFIDNGAFIFAANVTDKFGDYGTVIVTILLPDSPTKGEATMDTYLMSCRILGRGIETRFLDYILRFMKDRGMHRLHGTFIPTPKNKPSEKFFSEHHFEVKKEDDKSIEYVMDLDKYVQHPPLEINQSIKIINN